MRKLLYISILLPLLSKGQMSDCAPLFSSTLLEVNDIRARIGTPNVFFTNNGRAGFEVPAGDSVSSIYAHSDWIGGLTPDGTLHLAAGTYNTGGSSDFFTGPLRNDGTASTEEKTCYAYWELYEASRVDAILHKEYHDRLDLVNDGADPGILLTAPFENGYETPEYFYSWPAHSEDPSYDYYLAPFHDHDQDGHYDPDSGDFPGFDILGNCSCTDPELSSAAHLQGHEAIWQVYNDSGLHTETGGNPMGVEVQCTTFGFNHCGVLDETMFQRKRIINRSSNTYEDTYIGQWLDTDVGCPTDDFVGCDVTRGLAYAYNGDPYDNDCNGTQGYGNNPPIQSFQILAGPYQDADGLDNPLTNSVQNAIDSLGITYPGLGTGYGDAVVDNERIGLRRFTSFISHNLSITYPNEVPSGAFQFYMSLQGKWRDGSMVTHGEEGLGGISPARFMYPGISDPLGYSTGGEIVNGNWSEISEGHIPGDRRFVAITGSFTFEPGEVQELVTAFNWTEGGGSPFETENSMKIESDVIQAHFEHCFQLVNPLPPVESFFYEQTGNDLVFTLPYYYPYDASWSFDDGFTGDGLLVEHTFQEEGVYDVCVTVYNCDGPLELCEEISITALDLEEIESEELLLIYPNPVSDELYIHSSRLGQSIRRVKIYDVKGRLMQSSAWAEEQESLVLNSGFKPGIYSLQVQYGDGLLKSKNFLKVE